jgi:hypothetical protein
MQVVLESTIGGKPEDGDGENREMNSEVINQQV